MNLSDDTPIICLIIITILFFTIKGLYESYKKRILSFLNATYKKLFSKEISGDHIKTYCYLIASVVKADGKIDTNERKKVNEYINELFSSNAELAKNHINTFLHDRNNNIPFIKEDFIKTTHYTDRYALVEMLFSIAILNYFKEGKAFQSNKGKKDNTKNNKVEVVLMSIMKQLGIHEKDVIYMTNKYNIGNSKKEKKDGKRKYTIYENVEQKKAYQQQREECKQQRQQQAAEQKRQHLQYAYAVLGLPTSASKEELYAAYKDLAKKYHPDTVQQDFLKKQLTEKFKEITWAYNLLKNY